MNVLMCISIVLNVILLFVVIKLGKKLLDVDELFELLVDDIEVNKKYFDKLLSTPLFYNSEEVKTANNNMGIISKRLDEFSKRMREATNYEDEKESEK